MAKDNVQIDNNLFFIEKEKGNVPVLEIHDLDFNKIIELKK